MPPVPIVIAVKPEAPQVAKKGLPATTECKPTVAMHIGHRVESYAVQGMIFRDSHVPKPGSREPVHASGGSQACLSDPLLLNLKAFFSSHFHVSSTRPFHPVACAISSLLANSATSGRKYLNGPEAPQSAHVAHMGMPSLSSISTCTASTQRPPQNGHGLVVFSSVIFLPPYTACAAHSAPIARAFVPDWRGRSSNAASASLTASPHSSMSLPAQYSKIRAQAA